MPGRFATVLASGVGFPRTGSRPLFDANADRFWGVLDDQIIAHGAYSVARRLSRQHTGPLFRVRRSSDNTEQDIGYTALGVLNTAALTSFVGSGSGFVTKLYDQSDRARDAAQATAARQPKIVDAGTLITLSGKPSLLFDGVDDHFALPALGMYAAGGVSVHAIAIPEAAAQNGAIFSESSTGNPRYLPSLIGTDGRIYLGSIRNDAGATVVSRPSSTGTVINDGAAHQVTVRDTGNAIRHQVDGQASSYVSPVTRAGTLTVTAAWIGAALGASNAVNNAYKGRLSEILIWAPGLDSTAAGMVFYDQAAAFEIPGATF